MSMTVTHPEVDFERTGCPRTFEAEVESRTSQSGYDKPVADSNGNYPTLAGQLEAQGIRLTRAEWDELEALPNQSWTPTYEHVVLDEPVEHQVAVCPSCGTPVKV